MSDAEFADEMIGRILTDISGRTYVVVDFDVRGRHGALHGLLAEVVDGHLAGGARKI